jgi:hypothetical protein
MADDFGNFWIFKWDAIFELLPSNLNHLNYIRNEVDTYLNEQGKNNTKLFCFAPMS